MKKSGGRIEVQPLDGVRRRFHWMGASSRFHLWLDRDGFAAGRPVVAAENLSEISFSLENRSPNQAKPHTTEMRIVGTAIRIIRNRLGRETAPADRGRRGAAAHFPARRLAGREVTIRAVAGS